jgi:uncharacterized Ntn-hydrolase superfamily protein
MRAKIGATLLDTLRPGWANEITVDRLLMSECGACVLGQLFGDYGTGAEAIFAMRIDRDREKVQARGELYRMYDHTIDAAAQDAGFFVSDEDRLKNVKYSNLTAAWKREVAKRVGKGA